jgi:hypothetical protein
MNTVRTLLLQTETITKLFHWSSLVQHKEYNRLVCFFRISDVINIWNKDYSHVIEQYFSQSDLIYYAYIMYDSM